MGIMKYKTSEIIHITKQQYNYNMITNMAISSVIAFIMGYVLPFILARIFV